MDFGRKIESDISEIDFTINTFPKFTKETLDASGSGEFKQYIGAPIVGHAGWLGGLYPEKLKPQSFLDEYVNHFNFIEFNATFYSLYPADVIATWKSKAIGRDFIFCPKFYRNISHLKRLKDAESETEKFISSISAFEEHLGPCLLQLPDRFGVKQIASLIEYVSKLPKGFRVNVELRDESWFKDVSVLKDLFSFFREHNVGTAIPDTNYRRDAIHLFLSTPELYLRFNANDMHPTDLIRLEAWKKRIEIWKELGLKRAFISLHTPEQRNFSALAKVAVEISS